MNIKTITTDELRAMHDREGLILQGCGESAVWDFRPRYRTDFPNGIHKQAMHRQLLLRLVWI